MWNDLNLFLQGLIKDTGLEHQRPLIGRFRFPAKFKAAPGILKHLVPSVMLLEKYSLIFCIVVFCWLGSVKTCAKFLSAQYGYRSKWARARSTTRATNGSNGVIPVHLRWISTTLSTALSLWMVWHYRNLV